MELFRQAPSNPPAGETAAVPQTGDPVFLYNFVIWPYITSKPAEGEIGMEKSGSLKTLVYNTLMEEIVRGGYRPGEILTEGRLLERFDCSRAPIREALASLCGEGVLKNLPRFGYEVIRITMDDIRQMLQFRRLVEGGVMADTCRWFTEEDYRELYAMAEECSREGSSMWEHWEQNTRFHLKLLSLSRNEYAVRQLRSAMALLKVAYGQHYWGRWDSAYTADTHCHFRILDALKVGDAEEAARQLARDLEDFAVFQ